MKRIIFLLLLTLSASIIFAQSKKKQKETVIAKEIVIGKNQPCPPQS